MQTHENSIDPEVHRENIQRQLDDLIQRARQDMERVDDPGFQALLEITAEILSGLRAAYVHYGEKHRPPELPPL